MVKKKRHSYIVTLDHDPIPGWNNEPEDFQKWLSIYLKQVIPHYHPEVELLGEVVEPEFKLRSFEEESPAFIDLFFNGLRSEDDS
jgi:hypothetical protein